ncbi:MAG TPA: ATP-grasp domain-containing protein [Sedimentisphaerales bacterium]|nr:ATP-grasp domain-containing protein [Sedimentisphaerales bacterium]
MKLTIGLVYDLRKDYLAEGFTEEDVAEFDFEETIFLLEQAIQTLGYNTVRIGNVRMLSARLVAGEKWDLVFNIAEGLSGRCRESQVPAILDAYNIGYTFSDPLVCALTLDKGFAKHIVRDAGLPTAKFKIVEFPEDVNHIALEYPLFAKPIAEGTGKGIDQNSRIESSDQLTQTCECLLERFAQPVLVEEFLPGREFTIGVLGNGSDAYVLGIMEIMMPNDKNGAIYSYAVKEEWEKFVKYFPCPKGTLYRHLEQLALKSYKALQCRDAARVDFRCDSKGIPCFMEINPLPGLHPTHSDLPMIATQEGMKYEELIGQIIDNALKRLNG